MKANDLKNMEDLTGLKEFTQLNELQEAYKAVKLVNSGLRKDKQYRAFSLTLDDSKIRFEIEVIDALMSLLKLCPNAKFFLNHDGLIVADGSFRASFGYYTDNYGIYDFKKNNAPVKVTKGLFRFTGVNTYNCFEGVYMNQDERLAIASNNQSVLLSAVDFVELPESIVLAKTGMELLNPLGDKYRVYDLCAAYDKFATGLYHEVSYEKIRFEVKKAIISKKFLCFETGEYITKLNYDQLKNLEWLKPAKILFYKNCIVALCPGRVAMFVSQGMPTDENRKIKDFVKVTDFESSESFDWRGFIHQPQTEAKNKARKRAAKKVTTPEAAGMDALPTERTDNELNETNEQRTERTDNELNETNEQRTERTDNELNETNEQRTERTDNELNETNEQRTERTDNELNDYVYVCNNNNNNNNIITFHISDYQEYGYVSTTIDNFKNEEADYPPESKTNLEHGGKPDGNSQTDRNTGTFFCRHSEYRVRARTGKNGVIPWHEWIYSFSMGYFCTKSQISQNKYGIIRGTGTSPPDVMNGWLISILIKSN